MTRLLAVLVVLTVAHSAAAQDRLRVYISPPTTVDGFIDETLKGQQDTVADLAERLAKNDQLDLVDAPTAADVVIDVLGRGRRETGDTRTQTMRTPLGLLSHSEPDETKEVVLVLRAGAYEKELRARSDQVFGAWKAMAGQLAKQIEKWVRENERTLIARR